jgi:hypothetical protein
MIRVLLLGDLRRGSGNCKYVALSETWVCVGVDYTVSSR